MIVYTLRESLSVSVTSSHLVHDVMPDLTITFLYLVVPFGQKRDLFYKNHNIGPSHNNHA